jgi:sulfur carrier protein ThiS
MSMGVVELHIRPPLSYEVSKLTGGLVIQEKISENETLGDLLTRLDAKNPTLFKKIYDSSNQEIQKSIVTVVNGITVPRSEAMARELLDGDKIAWFLMYAGG